MKQRKTEIFIQTRERIFVRRAANELQMLCAGCQTETVFITPEQATLQTNANVREIFRRVEGGTIHFIETAEGITLICMASLLNSTVNQQTVFRLDDEHETSV